MNKELFRILFAIIRFIRMLVKQNYIKD